MFPFCKPQSVSNRDSCTPVWVVVDCSGGVGGGGHRSWLCIIFTSRYSLKLDCADLNQRTIQTLLVANYFGCKTNTTSTPKAQFYRMDGGAGCRGDLGQ